MGDRHSCPGSLVAGAVLGRGAVLIVPLGGNKEARMTNDLKVSIRIIARTSHSGESRTVMNHNSHKSRLKKTTRQLVFRLFRSMPVNAARGTTIRGKSFAGF